MKKLFLAAVIAAFGFTANAQDETPAFGFGEGDLFIEGNVGFSSTNDKNTDEKANGFNITPSVGYFITDDIAVGGTFSLNSYKQEVSGTDTEDQFGFGIGAFGRYYFLDLGERFKTNAEFGLGYLSMDDKLADVKENTFGAGLGLGMNYFVTEKIALTFGLKNVLSFSSSKLDVSGAKAVSEFNFGFGDVANPFGGNASFGLLFVL